MINIFIRLINYFNKCIPLSILLLHTFFAPSLSFATEQQVYSDADITLSCPSNCILEQHSKDSPFFQIRSNKTIVLEGEKYNDENCRMQLSGINPSGDIFHHLALIIGKGICQADGVDSHIYCDAIANERTYTTPHGLRVIELYLMETYEDLENNTKKKTRVGPVYLVDISNKDKLGLLRITPARMELASESARQLARQIINTVKLFNVTCPFNPSAQKTENEYFAAEFAQTMKEGFYRAFRSGKEFSRDTHVKFMTFLLNIKNKTNNDIEIIWDKTLFIYNGETKGNFRFKRMVTILSEGNIDRMAPEKIMANSNFKKVISPPSPSYYADNEGEYGIYLTVKAGKKEFYEKMFFQCYKTENK